MKEKTACIPLIEPAPMAGYTDQAFRRVLRRCGAKITWTEMVSAAALYYESQRTFDMLREDDPQNTVLQLFGKTPEHFEHALKSGTLNIFKEININMGCPARKIMKNGEGVDLMRTPVLARQIIETCVRYAKRPVSVKFRLGTAPENDAGTSSGTFAVNFAKMCEKAGVSRLIIHARYGTQGYSGLANHSAAAEVVRAVRIPVIVNGDITDPISASEILKKTGASGAMMGRALIGAPWKITETDPTEQEIKEIINFHIEQSIACHGEGSILPMRKHLLAYCVHLSGGKEMKKDIIKAKTFAEVKSVMRLVSDLPKC